MAKLIGAVLILGACAFFGFQTANGCRAEERTLRKLIAVLDFMSCELQYRLTPLPELCRQAAKETSGKLQKYFVYFSEEMESQISPNVKACSAAALERCPHLPELTKQCIQRLGSSMGRFDLQGQIRAIDEVRTLCRNHVAALEEGKAARLQSYQTLGICAGAALVILLV